MNKPSHGRILLIDDEVDILDYLSDFIQSLGFEVQCTSKIKEAMNIIDTQLDTFDFIVSDGLLPDGKGMEVLDYLNKKPNFVIPVFIFISGAYSLSLDETLGKGASEIFMKPINLEAFKKHILKHLIPREQRWSQIHEEKIAVKLNIDLKDFDLLHTPKLSLGREGMFVKMNVKMLPNVNAVVEFHIHSEKQAHPLVGRGVVRWKREAEIDGRATGFGLQFLDFEPDCIESILSLIKAKCPCGFIPDR